MISIVIPTISGREHHLERCLSAYKRGTVEMPFEVIVIEGKSTCGEAWAEGGEQAKGDYLHFSADDLEPHEDWWLPAVYCVDVLGKLPCPRIWSPNGALESCGAWGTEMPDGTETNIARIPFLSREQWEQGNWILDSHYYTDNWIWHRGQQLGIPTVVTHRYDFTHYYASEGRKSTLEDDYQFYVSAGGRF